MILIGPAVGAGVAVVLRLGPVVVRRVAAGPLERGRARSIAAASAPLHSLPVAAADREHVDAVHDMLVESRTDEQPIVTRVRRRSVQRPPSQRQLDVIRARRLKPRQDFAADPLSAPLAGPLAAPVLLSSVRSWEPEPWHLESFTQGWTSADIERLVAEAKAGAVR